MIKGIALGEELAISTKNKVGLLADMADMLAKHRINIEAVCAYETGKTAIVLLITSANLLIAGELRKKKYKSLKENEVIIVDLENKPGAVRTITKKLSSGKIDIKHLYVTSSFDSVSSRLIMRTSDNEAAIAALSKFVEPKEREDTI